MKTAARTAPAIALFALLAACQDTSPPADADATGSGQATDPALADTDAFDWSRCRIPGLSGPVPGRLFIVDGGDTVPGAEPGRESIRRVDIHVPGPVTLLLTAPDMTVWMLRPSRHTQMHAIIASGEESQRIAGLNLGNRRAEHSAAMGDPCGRYWAEGASEADLAETSTQLFGRAHDAVFRLSAGRVDIGVPEPLPQVRVREPEPLPPPAAPAPSQDAESSPEEETSEQ
jgi:hypothetical protein